MYYVDTRRWNASAKGGSNASKYYSFVLIKVKIN